MSDHHPWYRDGLAFECMGCGRCCSGPEEGYVWISNEEIKAAAEALELTPSQFKKKYAYRVGTRHSLIEKAVSKDCVFLTPTSNGKQCDIYEQRPLQCRTWPFWKENLRDPDDWYYAGLKCPGIDQGQWHSLKRIQSILRGKIDDAPKAVELWQHLRDVFDEHGKNAELFEVLASLYQNLDGQIEAANPSCQNCTKCCDFQTYGHRLYVTSLEMLYFLHGLTEQKQQIKAGVQGRCPYLTANGCTMRDYRPSGCRIFYCTDLPKQFQQEVTENTLVILRDLHQEFHVPYLYTDFLTWLEKLSGK